MKRIMEAQDEQIKTIAAKLTKAKRKCKSSGTKESKVRLQQLKNKDERLKQSQNNLAILQEALAIQNKKDKSSQVDIENDPAVVFKTKKKKKKGQEEQEAEAERALTQEEQALLAKFDQGDKEIDQMLLVVVDQLDRLKYHAEGIGQEINTQSKMMKKLHKKVDNSWHLLSKKESDLEKTLQEYRRSDRLCCDIILMIVIVCMFGLDVQTFQNKGYL